MTKPVTYVPPHKDKIRAYARAVCESLARKKGDSVYLDPQVVDGFTRFVEVSCQITANYLNQGRKIDQDVFDSAD